MVCQDVSTIRLSSVVFSRCESQSHIVLLIPDLVGTS